MQKGFNGLSTVNIELTSRCNKECWMCGRRKIDRDYPEISMDYGDMRFNLVEKLADEIPKGVTVQFHNNGEPTLYTRLGDALGLFPGNFRNFDTNGKLLVEKADEIINNLDTLTVSVVENDEEGDEQFEIVEQFLDIKKHNRPFMVYRLLGDVGDSKRWCGLPGVVATRVLHSPLGSFNYQHNPTVPEIGVCLDVLHHLVVNRFGYVSPCVRFDPFDENVIGDVEVSSLVDIWNGVNRNRLIALHSRGWRCDVPFCSRCEYWGVPIG